MATNEPSANAYRVVERGGVWTAHRAEAPEDVIYSGLDRASAIGHAMRLAGLVGEVHVEQPNGAFKKVYPL